MLCYFRMRYAEMARIIGVLLLGAALAGCSSIRLGYNNLPTLSYWWLDGYLDFDDAQAPQVRTELAQLLDWHRQNELPKFAALLQEAEALAPADITPAAVCRLSDEVRQRLMAVARQAEAAGAALLTRLERAQLGQLERKYAKGNAEYRKEWLALSPERRRAKRYDQLLERYEDFYGRLDGAQREVLRAATEASAFDWERQFAERERRQQRALDTLRRLQEADATAAQAGTAIRAYVNDIAAPPPGAWRDYQDALRDEGCRQLATLHRATTPAQRTRAAARLRSYQTDVLHLAGSGG